MVMTVLAWLHVITGQDNVNVKVKTLARCVKICSEELKKLTVTEVRSVQRRGGRVFQVSCGGEGGCSRYRVGEREGVPGIVWGREGGIVWGEGGCSRYRVWEGRCSRYRVGEGGCSRYRVGEREGVPGIVWGRGRVFQVSCGGGRVFQVSCGGGRVFQVSCGGGRVFQVSCVS